MEQYIKKSALVAEIERLMSIYNDDENNHHIAKYNILVDIRSFLDTLETKEIDLDEDVDRILEENDWNYDEIDFYEFAKHFYELGLKAKGEQP